METTVAIGEVLAGKYRVEQILGSGGMGVVVAAWHTELDRRVAVKFLHPGGGGERTEASERFRREARALAKIRSEHAARVLDVGSLESGAPYLVMEFLMGHDLAEEIRQRGPLPLTETIDYVLQAVEAIAEAHAAGIVHRDLKPANLFLARRPDGSSCLKVLDFGISKSLTGSSSVNEMSLTQTSALIGSPLYMSPEQMRSARDVDQRTDVWSIGSIMYEMLTGQTPYLAQTIPELCSSLLNDVPRPIVELRPDVPPRLTAIVMKCLEKDRNARYTNVGELATALVEFAHPSSQVHIERARRVLGATDVTLSGLGSNRNLLAPASAQSAPVIGSPFVQLPMSEPTVNSWGGTGGNVALPNSRRRSLVWALAVFSVASIGVAGALLFRLRSAHEAENLPPAVRTVAAQPPAAPSLPPLPPRSTTEVVPAAPVSSVTPAENPPSLGQAAPAPIVENVPLNRPVVPVKAQPTAKPASPPVSPSATDAPVNTISEFGGRR